MSRNRDCAKNILQTLYPVLSWLSPPSRSYEMVSACAEVRSKNNVRVLTRLKPAEGALVEIVMTKKLDARCVRNGNVVPLAEHCVVKRGGKIFYFMNLTPETAEALHTALGPMVKASRRKRRMFQASHLFERMFLLPYLKMVLNGVVHNRRAPATIVNVDM